MAYTPDEDPIPSPVCTHEREVQAHWMGFLRCGDCGKELELEPWVKALIKRNFIASPFKIVE